MKQYSFVPDADSYCLFFKRAIGPGIVFAITSYSIIDFMGNSLFVILFLLTVLCFWLLLFFVQLIRRKLYILEINIFTNGDIVVMEKSFFKSEWRFLKNEKFRVVSIVSALPFIRASDGSGFGEFLGRQQQLDIVSLLNS